MCNGFYGETITDHTIRILSKNFFFMTNKTCQTPSQNNESMALPSPSLQYRIGLYMLLLAWSVRGQWWGRGLLSPFTSLGCCRDELGFPAVSLQCYTPKAWSLCILASLYTKLYESTNGETRVWLNRACKTWCCTNFEQFGSFAFPFNEEVWTLLYALNKWTLATCKRGTTAYRRIDSQPKGCKL